MIYAATGHRPDKLGGYGPLAEARLRQAAHDFLAVTRPAGVISGMALGWDMAYAEAAVGLGIPFIAAVPFDGQESKWPAASQARWRNLCRLAQYVEIVSPGGYSAAAMQRRNEWMVDRADLVVAMWDGTRGGTANCLDYVGARGVPVVNLYPLWSDAQTH